MIITNEKTGKSISFTYSKKQDLIEAANTVALIEEKISDRNLKIEGDIKTLGKITEDLMEEVVEYVNTLSLPELGELPKKELNTTDEVVLTPIRLPNIFISEVGNVTFEPY